MESNIDRIYKSKILLGVTNRRKIEDIKGIMEWGIGVITVLTLELIIR